MPQEPTEAKRRTQGHPSFYLLFLLANIVPSSDALCYVRSVLAKELLEHTLIRNRPMFHHTRCAQRAARGIATNKKLRSGLAMQFSLLSFPSRIFASKCSEGKGCNRVSWPRGLADEPSACRHLL